MNYLELAAKYYQDTFNPITIGETVFTVEEFIKFRIDILDRDVIQETKDWKDFKDAISNNNYQKNELDKIKLAESNLINLIDEDIEEFYSHVTGDGW